MTEVAPPAVEGSAGGILSLLTAPHPVAVTPLRAGPSCGLPGQAPKHRTWVTIQSAKPSQVGQDSTGVDKIAIRAGRCDRRATACTARYQSGSWSPVRTGANGPSAERSQARLRPTNLF